MDGRRPLFTDRVLVCDGAMGTLLHAAGNSLDQSLPALNLSAPERVRMIHQSYLDAGVDIIQTNTFGAGRLRLAEYGFGDQVEDINRAGVRIARDAGGAERAVLVAGSVSPAVSVHQRHRVSSRDRVEALREQIGVLTEAGVDALLLETFGHLEELVEAVGVATERASVPVIAQATFTADGRTISGHSPRDVCAALAGAPIDALGTNCTVGPQGTLAILRELGEHCDLPLTAQPNAGLPRYAGPGRFEYDVDCEYFVRYVSQLLRAGVSVVGGCCGTTPTQLGAAAQTVRQEAPARPSDPGAFVRARSAGPGSSKYRNIGVELPSDLVADVDQAVRAARRLRAAGITTVSLPASQGTRPQVNPVDLALHLYQRVGVDTVPTVTTWDRTIMALQADLLGAHALGVRRVVCETGTPPLLGDYPHADGVWDVDSIGLIELLARLNAGQDCHGLPLPEKTDFEIGARVNPGHHDPSRARARARAKIAAGAQFLVTRPVFDLDPLRRMLDAIDGAVPLLVSVRPLTSFADAEYLAHEVPDVTIPESSLAALKRAGDDAGKAGLELAADVARQAATMADGLVIAPRFRAIQTTQCLLRLLDVELPSAAFKP